MLSWHQVIWPGVYTEVRCTCTHMHWLSHEGPLSFFSYTVILNLQAALQPTPTPAPAFWLKYGGCSVSFCCFPHLHKQKEPTYKSLQTGISSLFWIRCCCLKFEFSQNPICVLTAINSEQFWDLLLLSAFWWWLWHIATRNDKKPVSSLLTCLLCRACGHLQIALILLNKFWRKNSREMHIYMVRNGT